MIHNLISRSIRRLEGMTGDIFPAEDQLVTLLFHGVGENNHVLPGQNITLVQLEECIINFKKHRYQFMSPDDVMKGLLTGRRVLLTFDDGYANNLHVLPLLKRYNVPAIFFIASHYIESGKSFWWDSAYRGLKKHGATEKDAVSAIRDLKRKPWNILEREITEKFGVNIWQSIGDTDRPLTSDELKKLSAEPLVTIGNHTMHHTILTNESPETQAEEMRQCQIYLETVLGNAPTWISYPNGYTNTAIENIAVTLGLQAGIQVHGAPMRLPVSKNHPDIMHVHRYAMNTEKDMTSECAKARRRSFLFSSVS